MELSPGSIAMTAPSSSPTVLSVSLPDPSNLSLTGAGTLTAEGVKPLPLASADGVIQNAVPPVVPLADSSARISVLDAEGIKSLPLASADGAVQNAVPPTAEIMNPLATIGTTTTTETPEIEAAGEAIAKPLDRILMPLKAQGSGSGLALPISANSQSAATVVVENSVDVVSQDRAVAHLGVGVFRLGNELLSWRQTNLSSGMVVNPVVTQPTDSTLQMPADELTPVPALVNVVRENSTRSDHSISIPQNLSATTAAPIARPQLANELDSVGLHLENALQDSTVIRGVVEPTSPARGSGLAPTPVILTAPSRPEAVTSPTFPSSFSDVLDFQQSHWERTLGQQLNWMVNNRVHEASIRVNPPDLGPIEVRVSLQQNQTNVTFFSHEAAVREAIENAMPRLREMLGSQGIALNQALVSDQSLARQQAGFGEQPQERRGNGSVLGTPDQNSVNDEVDRQPHSRRLLGMVDHYV
jgi:flagellar hook-length control protein FliK